MFLDLTTPIFYQTPLLHFYSSQRAFDFVNASFLHFLLELSRLKISYVFYFLHISICYMGSFSLVVRAVPPSNRMQVLTNCQSLYLHQYGVHCTQALLISLHVPRPPLFEMSTAASVFLFSILLFLGRLKCHI